jgi:hypothetical protein
MSGIQTHNFSGDRHINVNITYIFYNTFQNTKHIQNSGVKHHNHIYVHLYIL